MSDSSSDDDLYTGAVRRLNKDRAHHSQVRPVVKVLPTKLGSTARENQKKHTNQRNRKPSAKKNIHQPWQADKPVLMKNKKAADDPLLDDEADMIGLDEEDDPKRENGKASPAIEAPRIDEAAIEFETENRRLTGNSKAAKLIKSLRTVDEGAAIPAAVNLNLSHDLHVLNDGPCACAAHGHHGGTYSGTRKQITVRLLDSTTNEVHRLDVGSDDRLIATVGQHLAQKLGVEAANIHMSIKGKVLSHIDTPFTTGLKRTDHIDFYVHIPTAPEATSAGDDAGASAGDDEITLKLQCGTRQLKAQLRVSKKSTFEGIRAEYAGHHSLDVASVVRFQFDGEPLEWSDTPEGQDMEDDDCVDVILKT